MSAERCFTCKVFVDHKVKNIKSCPNSVTRERCYSVYNFDKHTNFTLSWQSSRLQFCKGWLNWKDDSPVFVLQILR